MWRCTGFELRVIVRLKRNTGTCDAKRVMLVVAKPVFAEICSRARMNGRTCLTVLPARVCEREHDFLEIGRAAGLRGSKDERKMVVSCCFSENHLDRGLARIVRCAYTRHGVAGTNLRWSRLERSRR